MFCHFVIFIIKRIDAGLSMNEQLLVFEKSNPRVRKIVVSTNIAEASVTIDGIVYVVDCGFVKLRAFNPDSAMDALVLSPVSKSSAIQRAGRAGRVRPGKAYRLYTESEFQKLRENNIPDIQRCNLATAILQLKALGINNIVRFDFLTPPPPELLMRSFDVIQ